MHQFNGQFHYRSFCPKAGGKDRAAQITAPWTPPGVLTVATDETGKVTGTLKFGAAAELKVSGSITPASEKDGLPEGFDLVGEGMTAVYRVRGYFVEGVQRVTGSVLSTQNDLAGQPPGTIGPFILFPV